jgi:hypothetical protein
MALTAQLVGSVRLRVASTVAGAVLAAALAATPALAQSVGATLQGTVADPQGGVLPGAVIVVTNVETGWTREQIADERGWFRMAALPRPASTK